MKGNVFIDSNVLLYGLDNSSKGKKARVHKILRENEYSVSPQVIFECLNVATRKFKLSKKDALAFISRIVQFAEIINEDSLVVNKALLLYRKHSFQVYDSKIVAAALLAGCKILYSEDFQHGQIVDTRLKIINPFI